MFFFSCTLDISPDIKEKIRTEIIERTGEDCIFLPSELGLVQRFRTAKEMATPSIEAILKIAVRNTEKRFIDSALKLVEEVKANHPDLFQQIEVVLEC